jgi:hypothetical protein
MSEDDETESDGRMGRADRIRSTREGRRSQPRRSRSEGDADESESQQTGTQSSQTSQRAQTSQSSRRNEGNTATQPVKDRPHRTVYLPSALDDEFDSQIDRIQYEAKHETEGEKVQLAKNRHVYPLIVHLGLERVGEMTIDELLATLAEADTLDAPDQ